MQSLPLWGSAVNFWNLRRALRLHGIELQGTFPSAEMWHVAVTFDGPPWDDVSAQLGHGGHAAAMLWPDTLPHVTDDTKSWLQQQSFVRWSSVGVPVERSAGSFIAKWIAYDLRTFHRLIPHWVKAMAPHPLPEPAPIFTSSSNHPGPGAWGGWISCNDKFVVTTENEVIYRRT